MKTLRGHRTLALVAVLLTWASEALATLTPSEVEQVHYEVAAARNVEHVRALVARPDLSLDEASDAVTGALSGTALDSVHAEYLRDLVFGSNQPASRPTLAVAVVRGLVARADALLEQTAALASNTRALAEVARAYALVEDIVAADAAANIPETSRADCAQALAQHVARNLRLLGPDAAVGPAVASVRAQAAIALLDATPPSAGRRVDVANELVLSGARRAALIELGTLVLDQGGSDARVLAIRRWLELPGVREGAEVVVLGAPPLAPLRARGGVVLAAAPAGGSPALTEATSPWGSEVAAPPIDEATLALVHDLMSVAMRRALELRPLLRAAVARDGGERGVVMMAAMLEIDARRTLDAAATRLFAGKRESMAWLSDAVGALAVFSGPAKGADGLTVPLGHAETGGPAVFATRVSLDATGAASALRFGARTWRIARDERGAVTGLSRF